jgi:serine/threonine protein kinase
MTDSNKNSRPSCDKILSSYALWGLSINQLKQKTDIAKFLEKFKENTPEKNFHAYMIEKMYENQMLNEKSISEKQTLIHKHLKNGKYEREFKQMSIIATGSFSEVYKAKSKSNNKIYAIKKISLSSNYDYLESFNNEIKMISKLENKFVVSCPSSWVEEYNIKNERVIGKNFTTPDYALFKSEKIFILHIQMEYCAMTLRDAINKLNEELNQKETGKLTTIGYFIASELLIEILDSVNYLHNNSIIHRDLKPTNILVSEGQDGQFVKIADFGLATIHNSEEDESHTQASGTLKYMAPEVLRTRKYDTKADIYSLGVIIAELFNFDIYK